MVPAVALAARRIAQGRNLRKLGIAAGGGAGATWLVTNALASRSLARRARQLRPARGAA
jgi:hypothetical protein